MPASRYEIRQELGRGGMGVVYQGYDTLLKRTVAIKVISNLQLGAEGRVRLMAEAQAVAQLNHPNIVTIYDVVDEEPPFIVMELVRGKTLRQTRVKDTIRAIEISRQICLALDHAHSNKVIHRDLKPENVIVLPSGSIKLMDFGLALTPNATRITASGAFIGTASYIAPELLQNGEPSTQSDLYALGVILFEMLTGECPFQGADILQVISQHLYAPIPAPNKLRHNIPDMLNELVMQLLEKKPENRPSSASEVEKQINSLQVQQSRPTLSPSSGIEYSQSIMELANKRKHAQNEWDKEWRRKGYIKSSLPVLESAERELILSNQAKELKKGVDYLNNHRLLIITGMPGIGKSTLARAMLEFMPANSPPPFWYDFERQKSSGNTLGVLLDRIASYLENCFGEGVHQEVMSFRQTPGGKPSIHEVDVLIDYLNQETPIWLVFDNLETVLSRGSNGFDDPDLELLFDALKSYTHNAKIIITNPFIPILHDGQYLLEFGTQPLTLQGLDGKSATEYLRVHGLQNLPEETLAAIARTASGHPFTLNHIARYIQSMGVDQELDTLLTGLDEITNHFKLSLEHRLSQQEFSALKALSVLNREISLDGLRQTANTTPTTIKRLRDEGLLQTNDTGKFWLHNIVRTSLSSTEAEIIQSAHVRASIFYRNQKIPHVIQSIDDFINTFEWYDHALQAGDMGSCYDALFSTNLEEYLTKWNEYHLLVELCEGTLSRINPAISNLSVLQKVKLLKTLGVARYFLNELNKSIDNLMTALSLMDTLESMVIKSELFIHLAYSYQKYGDITQAKNFCQQAFNLMHPETQNEIMARALHLRGTIYQLQGEFVSAIVDLEAALRLYKSLHNQLGIGNTTGDLGVVYYYLGNYDKALECYRVAIVACEVQQNSIGIMTGHYNIGDFLLQNEQYEEAVDEFQIVLYIARKKKFKEMELDSGLNLVEAYIYLSQAEIAESELVKLKPVIHQSATPCNLGKEMILTAQLYWMKNDHEKTIECFKRGFNLLENTDCKDDQCGRSYLSFAKFLKEIQQVDKAKEALQKGKEIFLELNNPLGLRTVDKVLKIIQTG